MSSKENTMGYRVLGTSGLKVAEVGLGTMNFNESNQTEAFEIIREYIGQGGNFIDTADVYSMGQSEAVVGNFLEAHAETIDRNTLVIATKVFFAGNRTDPNRAGLSRYHIKTTVEESLKRLKTDRIDLLQIHNWDELTPVKEWVGTMNDLIKEGKIRFYGVCNVTGWQLQKILSTAEALGLHAPVSVQNQYSLLSRQVEWEVVHCALANGVAVLPWSPLKGGWLTGKFRKDEDPDPKSRVGLVRAYVNLCCRSVPSIIEPPTASEVYVRCGDINC